MTSFLSALGTPGAVSRSFAVAPKEPDPIADDAMPDIPSRTPRSIRAYIWLVHLTKRTTVFGTIRAVWRLCGNLRRLVMLWVLGWYPMIYGFVTAVTGGRVEESEYEQRNGECAGCDGRITIRAGWFARRWASYRNQAVEPRHYCGPCGCLKWFMARLAGWFGKNRWRNHLCPRELHTATDYPDVITISPSGCGQTPLKIPGGRARSKAETGGDNGRNDS